MESTAPGASIADPVLTRVLSNPVFISENMPAGTLRYTITQFGEPARWEGTAPAWGTAAGTNGRMSINGITFDVLATDTLESIWGRMVDIAPYAGVDLSRGGGNVNITSIQYGSHLSVDLGGDPALWAHFGLTEFPGRDVEIDVTGLFHPFDPANPADPALSVPVNTFNDSVFVSSQGNRVTLTSAQGHTVQLSIYAPHGYRTGDPALQMPAGVDMQLRIEEFGGLRIQIGPSYNMSMDIQIPRVSAETLGLAEFRSGEMVRLLHFTTQEGAARAIDQLDNAIAKTSRIRARLGAYQNRLEHTVRNLDNASLNTESARSRVQDADIAREMTLYSKRQVMYQAGIAILGQANQRPQMILSLLQ